MELNKSMAQAKGLMILGKLPPDIAKKIHIYLNQNNLGEITYWKKLYHIYDNGIKRLDKLQDAIEDNKNKEFNDLTKFHNEKQDIPTYQYEFNNLWFEYKIIGNNLQRKYNEIKEINDKFFNILFEHNVIYNRIFSNNYLKIETYRPICYNCNLIIVNPRFYKIGDEKEKLLCTECIWIVNVYIEYGIEYHPGDLFTLDKIMPILKELGLIDKEIMNDYEYIKDSIYYRTLPPLVESHLVESKKYYEYKPPKIN